MRRYALRDDQWEKIKDLLPGREGHVGGTAKDNRLFVDAVLYRYRAGIPWRDLPERFGDFRVVHTRHSRWSKSGVWERIFEVLSEDADNEYGSIDATIVRAHQHSAGAKKKARAEDEVEPEDQAIGRSRGGLSTKIHATCDALGNPTGFFLSGGQAHDAKQRVRQRLLVQDCEAVIPSKSNRKQPYPYDQHLYKARHLIENFFARLKQYRAIATRYDKTARNFLGAIYLAAFVVWLN